MIEAKKLALRIVEAARDKKALRPVILDLTGVSGLCDFFVILSGTSLRHTNAIAQGISEELEKLKVKSLSKVSPNDESGWVVLDYVSVVAHVFYKPMREFYSLERLWSDAKRVRIPREIKIK
ncbi:MAG: ribosome silencing factor [Candidatus Omnitrophota bacterium]|nr:ribosome silencing factor [Candidatus Omnitrophota bacterium]